MVMENILGLDDLRPTYEPELTSWIDKAVDAGLKKPPFKFGMIYLKGDLVTQDIYQAYKYFKKASDNGSKRASFQCGRKEITNGRLDFATRHYRNAASAGHKKAEAYLTAIQNNHEIM